MSTKSVKISVQSEEMREMNKLIFANLKLLDYKFPGTECNSPEELFHVPRSHLFEDSCYFLLTTLGSQNIHKLKKVWPILSRNDKTQFYKECHIALKEISKHKDASFPSFGPSLLLSPGGPQFTHFYLAFTTYVVERKLLDIGEVQLHLSYPKLSPNESWKNDLITTSLEGSIRSAIQDFVAASKQMMVKEELFEDLMRHQVQEFRLNKAEQELRMTLAELQTKFRTEFDFAPDALVDTDDLIQQQKQQLKEVHTLWNEFYSLQKSVASSAETFREAVAVDIVEGLEIDATQWNLNIPNDVAALLGNNSKEMETAIANLKEDGNYDLNSLLSLGTKLLSSCATKIEEYIVNNPDLSTREERYRNCAAAHKLQENRLKTLRQEMQDTSKDSTINQSNVVSSTYQTIILPALQLFQPLTPLHFSVNLEAEMINFDENLLGLPLCPVSSSASATPEPSACSNHAIKVATNEEHRSFTPQPSCSVSSSTSASPAPPELEMFLNLSPKAAANEENGPFSPQPDVDVSKYSSYMSPILPLNVGQSEKSPVPVLRGSHETDISFECEMPEMSVCQNSSNTLVESSDAKLDSISPHLPHLSTNTEGSFCDLNELPKDVTSTPDYQNKNECNYLLEANCTVDSDNNLARARSSCTDKASFQWLDDESSSLLVSGISNWDQSGL